jgi:hypothetical protein
MFTIENFIVNVTIVLGDSVMKTWCFDHCNNTDYKFTENNV